MEISWSTALEIFGLKEGFSEDDVKKEYRRLVKLVHPDRGGDEKLFQFVDSCKNLLMNGEKGSKSTNETNHNEANSDNPVYEKSTSSKENVFINLEDLNKAYPDYIGEYEEQYNIREIRAALLIYIQPRFRKNIKECFTVEIKIPYSQFNKQLGIVKLNSTIKIPKEMQKFRKFKVCVKFLGKTSDFYVSDGDIKLIEYAKFEYVKCLRTICELHFKK